MFAKTQYKTDLRQSCHFLCEGGPTVALKGKLVILSTPRLILAHLHTSKAMQQYILIHYVMPALAPHEWAMGMMCHCLTVLIIIIFV